MVFCCSALALERSWPIGSHPLVAEEVEFAIDERRPEREVARGGSRVFAVVFVFVVEWERMYEQQALVAVTRRLREAVLAVALLLDTGTSGVQRVLGAVDVLATLLFQVSG
jgi:hypothetical protein